jgi:hypothetical protein
MKKLMLESNAESLRFWGKIYGTESDYYVIQGNLKAYPMGNPKPHVESRGNEGINCYTFWVTSSILEGWYELPNITHEQMVASRNFKYHFSGDLNAKVRSFNYFPGKESHLLKCQILRVMHSSWIVPDGYLRTNPKFVEDLDNKVTEFNDEYQPAPYEDMKSDEKWVHEFAYIFPNGKIIDATQENQIGRMESISKDEGYQKMNEEGNPEDVKYWKIRYIGDQMQYTVPNGTTTYAAIVIKNTRWPGTHCIWKVFININVIKLEWGIC